MLTVFCDIDGCIIEYTDRIYEGDVLPGAREKLLEWHRKGYNIILTTGRPETMRKCTEEYLVKNGIFFDQLIMGLKNFPRVLINDEVTRPMAKAINIPRNSGIQNIDLEEFEKGE